MTTCAIRAAPGTDIWRKPPHTDVWNAPARAPPGATTTTSGPLQSFLSARVSFSSLWTEQYDQGGLLFSLRKSDGPSSSSTTTTTPPPKWIKTGVEFYFGKPMLSTVATDAWADWSVAPLTATAGSGADAGKTWTTVSVEKEGNEHGVSFWVYHVLGGGEKVPLREICWVFGDEPEKWEVEVLALAARPKKDAEGELEVEFKDFELRWK